MVQNIRAVAGLFAVGRDVILDGSESDRSRLQPVLRLRIAVNRFLLLIPFLLGLAFPACIPLKNIEVGGTSQPPFAGPGMSNTRFVVVGQESLQPSKALWLRDGDQLGVRWDSYTLLFAFDGAQCNFNDPNFTRTDQCQRCNYCGSNAEFSRQCRNQYNLSPTGFDPLNTQIYADTPLIVSCDGFVNCTQPVPVSPLTIVPAVPHEPTGCPPPASGPPLSFTPATNATYQILAPDLASYNKDGNDLRGRVPPIDNIEQKIPAPPERTEKKVFVIKNGMPQLAIYEGTRRMMNTTADCDLATPGCTLYTVTTPSGCTPATNPTCKVDYRWTIPITTITSNGTDLTFWRDNFSKNLRVSKVRVLKGKPSIDPNGIAQVTCDNPDVVYGCSVRPSRIFFVSDYDPWTQNGGNLFNHPDESSHRCYASDPGANKLDGDIDLTRCRRDPGGPDSNSFQVGPTIGDNNQATVSGGVGLLTWFAEFNPNELAMGRNVGATAPTLNPGETLVFEFTIQAVQ